MHEIKINLGSGHEYKEGYINVDDGSIFDAKRDVTADLFTYDREPESVDEILLSHIVMYIRPEELKPLLKRWYGWLKKGGRIIIETSDINKAMKIALGSSKSEEWGMINIFGTPETGPHRWGWSPAALTVEIYHAGFRDLKYSKGDKKPERDYKLTATK